MKDWLSTIDDYLRMTRRDILDTKGRVTHSQALEKAHREYEVYKAKNGEIPSAVEIQFLDSIRDLEEIEEQPLKS